MTYSYLYEADSVKIPMTKTGRIKNGFIPYIVEEFRHSPKEFLLLRGFENQMHTTNGVTQSTNSFNAYISKNGYRDELGLLVLTNGNILIFKGERIRKHGSK